MKMLDSWNCPEHNQGRHTWKSAGLDTYRGQLVNTRKCLSCGCEQVKTYGGHRAWRERHREPADNRFPVGE